jgi:hypothetical protein
VRDGGDRERAEPAGHAAGQVQALEPPLEVGRVGRRVEVVEDPRADPAVAAEQEQERGRAERDRAGRRPAPARRH